jgi:excisionase family DNA binding protein
MTISEVHMFLTTKDVIQRLKIAKTTLYNWRRAGEFIPETKAGRTVRFSEADFNRWLERRTNR